MPAFSFLAQEPSYVLASTDLAAVPLFLLMGVFASMAGFSEDVYRAAAAFLGHRRGGLAYATISGSAAFGAICGSSTATAATFAKVASAADARPRLFAGILDRRDRRRRNAEVADPAFAGDDHLLRGRKDFHPRYVRCRHRARLDHDRVQSDRHRRRRAAAAADRAGQCARIVAERFDAARQAAPSLALLLGVFVGIYSGIFTVNEAASAAAILALLFALARRRMTWRGIRPRHVRGRLRSPRCFI